MLHGILVVLGILIGVGVFSAIITGIITTMMIDEEKLRDIKQKNGIIWNPLKIGFYVTSKKYCMFGITEILFVVPGSFICQFFIKKNKTEKFSIKLYRKLNKRYLNKE